MTEATPQLLRRSTLLLALLAMLATLVPATAADAQGADGWNAAVACPADLVRDSGLSDATGTHGASIDCIRWYDITRGLGDGTYGTNDNVKRDQTASFIVRLLQEVEGYSVPPRRVNAFRDVRDGVHRNNIERLANTNPRIVQGFPDGRFQPREDVTRAQFASIVTRMLDELASEGIIQRLPASGNRFNDTRGSVHESNINRLAAAGIVFGRTANRFDPNDPITRGQVASIFARTLGGLVERGVVYLPEIAVFGIVNDGTDMTPGEISDDGVANAEVAAVQDGEFVARRNANSNGRFRLQIPNDGVVTLFATGAGYAGGPRVDIRPREIDVDEDIYLRVYRAAPEGVPAGATPTTSTLANMSEVDTDRGEFWRIQIYVGGVRVDGRDATEVRYRVPGGAVMELGAVARDAWFEKNGNTSAYAEGNHDLYYRFDGDWYRLRVRFNANGNLTHVNP